jgi:protein-S-isoprenylcysteine O-methyltransferase Ste14
MQLKGIDKLREKLPAYPGKKIAIIPLRGALAGLLGYIFLILLVIIPRLFSNISLLGVIEPFLPMAGSLFISGLALWLIWGVWNKREQMKEIHGSLAYQKIIPRGVTGVFMVPPIVFLAFTSIRSLPPTYPINDLTIQWSRSLLPFIGLPPEIEIWIRMGLSGIFIILGALTIRSAILTFGLDYMTVVYLYFPEESEIQEHEIYSVVRHPTYLGGVFLGIAGLFFRFSIYSIFLGLLVYLVFRLQIWKEEKELIERFGEGYNEYRKKVPALLLRPSKIKSFIRFLRTGHSSSKQIEVDSQRQR